ncbi:MAG: hypothetical protein HY248_04210, partial [Fimbriimonas ginsengisoli]|nr:hypothetical protein [Fimbriimonas ginsengisoli]
EAAWLAPDGGAAVYVSQGAAWVMPFLRVSREQFLEARRAALRSVAISNAKQIGLAIMMYIQDYDETYPPAGATINDRLSPYLKNKESFNTPGTDTPGFVYLSDVSPQSSINEPATTTIGYLLGPGGRALIYADGHVVWQEDKPRQR